MAQPAGRATSGRGSRLLLVYCCVIGLGIVTLVVVLSIGRRIDPTPQLPALMASDVAAMEAARCLGSRVAVVQSGVFADLHSPQGTGPLAEEALSERFAHGRVDRGSGRLALSGRCAGPGELSGRPFTANLSLQRGERDRGIVEVVSAGGSLQIEGTSSLAVELRAIGDGSDQGRAPAAAPVTSEELTARVLLAIAVVTVAALLLGHLLTWVRQPRVMGEILAGILLGPTLLGELWPDVGAYLFAPEVVGVLRVMAHVGLVLFMFIVGLKLDRSLGRGSGHDAVLVSHVSIVFPFAFGMMIALVLYPLFGRGSFAGFALFMGAAMAITAFPVLARILADTGMDRTRVGVLAITCAAVDDATAWCLLAVVAAVVRASGFLGAVGTVALTGVFAGAALWGVRPAAARLSALYDSRARLRPPILAVVLATVLMAGWITESIGSHAIFGAFLLGLSFPRSDLVVSDLVAKLEDVTNLLLLPIFFAIVGLSTRIGATEAGLWWGVTLLVLLAAVLGKWGSSTLAGRALGLDWKDSNALGILMNTRGLTEIVVLSIGRSLGVVSPALFAVMVVMALVTTLMTTPMLHLVHGGAAS